MAYFSLLILIASHALCWMAGGGQKLQHSPVKMITLLSGMHTIPQYIICTISPESSWLYPSLGSKYIDYFVEFGILYSLGLFMQILFTSIACKIKMPKAAKLSMGVNYPFKKAALFLFTIYVAIMLIYFNEINGLQYYLAHFNERDELRAGMGIFDMFRFPAAYLTILFLVASYKNSPKSTSNGILLIVIFMAIIEALLGGRRGPIQFLLFGLIGLLMVDRNRKLFSMSSIVVVILSVSIFVGLYYFRALASPQTGADIGILVYLMNFSYNDIYIFVISHFSNNDFWYGSVYLDIFYKIFSYFGGSIGPSPDEGLYVYNLYKGNLIEPPMIADQMYQNSFPPRTFGNGYMNFGIVGVLIFFSIKGALTGLAYKIMTQSSYNPFFMYIYLIMIFSFQLSNLKLFEFITVCVALIILLIPLRLIKNWQATTSKPS
jgi:oligosaccharide repeat unit polymerase